MHLRNGLELYKTRVFRILSLARLPFRHARNRHQVAPPAAESQAGFAARDCASGKVCLRSGHVILDPVAERRVRGVARRRVERLRAVGAKPVERGKRAAFRSGQKPRQRHGLSRRD